MKTTVSLPLPTPLNTTQILAHLSHTMRQTFSKDSGRPFTLSDCVTTLSVSMATKPKGRTIILLSLDLDPNSVQLSSPLGVSEWFTAELSLRHLLATLQDMSQKSLPKLTTPG